MECWTKLEGNTLKLEDLEDLFQTKDALIVLTVEGNKVECFFSEPLEDNQVLDILSFVTSEMYKTVE